MRTYNEIYNNVKEWYDEYHNSLIRNKGMKNFGFKATLMGCLRILRRTSWMSA